LDQASHLSIIFGLALCAGAPQAHAGASADWELAVHTLLLEELDSSLACATQSRGRPVPPWLHLTFRVAPDGQREAFSAEGIDAPGWLRRCLNSTVPVTFPAHDEETPRTTVRTLFFDDGLAEDGFPGPQRLRLPLLLQGKPEKGLAGADFSAALENDSDRARLPATSFVLTPEDALLDLRRRLWLQNVRDAMELRRPALLACGAQGHLAVGVTGAGQATLQTQNDGCAGEVVREIVLSPAPDGAPGRLALYLTSKGFQRAEWPSDQGVLLSEADEVMVLRAKERAATATSECYARALSRPFRGHWSGQLSVGVVIGTAGEVSDVLTTGELAGGSFATCVADAHAILGFPAPKDGMPILLLVRYDFSVDENLDAVSLPEPDQP